MPVGRPLFIALLPELAGPWDALIIALVGGMLLWSADVIVRRVIIPALGAIPIIGSQAQRFATDVTLAVEHAVHSWAESVLAPLTHTIRRIDNRLRNFARVNTLTHQATLAALRRVRYDDLPRVQNALIAFIQNRVAAVLAYVQAGNAQLAAYARALTAQAIAYAAARADALSAALRSTQATLLADDRATALYARQLALQAITRADQEIARAARAAQLDDQRVIAYAQSLASLSQQYARQLALDNQRQTVTALQTAESYTRSTGAAILGLVLPAVALLAGRVKAIEDSPCQQQCDTLGKVAVSLDGLDLAALLALLVGAAEHPKEAAPLINEVLAPGARLISGPLAGLFK